MRLVLLFIAMSLMGQKVDPPTIRTLNFDQLEPSLHHVNDTIYLVNFWATWCGPCRAEMPAIEEAGQKYHADRFKVLLVSLDFPNQLNEKLVPYIKANHLHAEVILLDDPKQNSWIDKVDPGWSGELPFTLIYGRNFRETYARSFRSGELDSIVQAKLKTNVKM